jgi:hypothetical protein
LGGRLCSHDHFHPSCCPTGPRVPPSTARRPNSRCRPTPHSSRTGALFRAHVGTAHGQPADSHDMPGDQARYSDWEWTQQTAIRIPHHQRHPWSPAQRSGYPATTPRSSATATSGTDAADRRPAPAWVSACNVSLGPMSGSGASWTPKASPSRGTKSPTCWCRTRRAGSASPRRFLSLSRPTRGGSWR